MKKTKGIVVLFLSLVLVLTTIVGFGFETMPVFADDETPEFEIEDNVPAYSETLRRNQRQCLRRRKKRQGI